MSNQPAGTNTPPANADEAYERLRSLGGRITRVRREMVDFFYRHNGRYTADEIAAKLPGSDPATVYRTLNSLEEAGIVEHVHLGHGPATYRRAGTGTIPVVCEQCGKVVHVPRDEFTTLGARLQQRFGFTIDLRHFALTGRCRACTPRTRKRASR